MYKGFTSHKSQFLQFDQIFAIFAEVNKNRCMTLLEHIGRYSLLIKRAFSRPEKHKMYYIRLIREMEALGINSVGIVVLISFFMGAVITIQTAYNTENPLLPAYLIGLAARDSILLEFSSTIVALILAGKVGSRIASEIGTMKVTEQIDALEIMGVNSASYLILPKILALILLAPFLTLISMIVGIFGGWVAGVAAGAVTSADYISGIQYAFIPFYITYSIIKSVVFAFIITSVSSYHGYYTEGGALEVGRSSTLAVVHSSVFILLFNLILTQLLLS
jgi:phospholipid/cholesterol/gamma-HCH transport system permease protein